MVPPEVTATETTALVPDAAVGGTVQDINEKLVTTGLVHKLPSTVTDEDEENPVPVTFNI